MSFVFRPTVPYAAYMRRRCQFLAETMTTDLLRRVEDGFIIQIKRLPKKPFGYMYIADVVDIPGMIYVVNSSNTLGTVAWLGGKIQFDRDSTLALYSNENPVFPISGTPYSEYPTRYVSDGISWGSRTGSATYRMPTTYGPNIVHCMVSATVSGERVITVHKVIAGSRSIGINQSDFFSATVTDAEVGMSAGSIDTIEFPVSAIATVNADTTTSAAIAALDTNTSGYVLIRERFSDPSDPTIQTFALCVGRFIVAEGTEDQPPTADIQLLKRITVADVPVEDRPDSIPAVDVSEQLGPASSPTASWQRIGVTGHLNSTIWNPDVGVYQYLAPVAGNSTVGSRSARPTSWRLISSAGLDAMTINTMPQHFMGADETGCYILFNASVYKDTAPFDLLYQDSETLAQKTVTGAEVFPAEATYTYLAHIAPDGAFTIQRIAQSIVAMHDERWFDQPLVFTEPLTTINTTDGPVFVCHQITYPSELLAVASPGTYTSNYYFPPGFARSENSGIVLISKTGASVALAMGDYYPVVYHMMDGRTNISTSVFTEQDMRFNLGRATPESTGLGVLVEFSFACSVCEYAPGYIAVVVAPQAEYSETEQTGRIAVFEILTGSMVLLSEPILPFTISDELRDGELMRWTLSCMEQGTVDDEGVLLTHGVLLLNRTSRRQPNILYRLQGLNTLVPLGIYPGGSRGSAYYMGTPLSPATLDETTHRPIPPKIPV